MPKYRQLHLKILDSFDFNYMPDDFTRVVWLLLPLIVDSEGRGFNNPAWVRSKMFPMREDVTIPQLAKSLEWMANRKMIVFYDIGGDRYFYIPTFKIYQTGTNHEGKSYLPAPPDLLRGNSEVTTELVQSNANPTVLYCIESELNLNDKTIFSIRDAERAYLQVTEFVAVPGGIFEYLEKIQDMLQHYGWNETITKLTDAKNDWVKGKRKDNGANYKVTNPQWINNAIAGETVGVKELTRDEINQKQLEELARRMNP